MRKGTIVFLVGVAAASLCFAQHSPTSPGIPTSPPPAPTPTPTPTAPPPPPPAPAPAPTAPTTPTGPAIPAETSIPSGATHEEKGPASTHGETGPKKSKLQEELAQAEKEEAHAWEAYKKLIEEKGEQQGHREEFCKSWRLSHERAVEASERCEQAAGTAEEPVLKRERDARFRERDAAEIRLRKIQEELDRFQSRSVTGLKKYEQARAKSRRLQQEIFDATNLEPRR